MDDWSLALLSCKLNMIGVNAGEVIKQQGASSDYAFILLGGAAKVLVLRSALVHMCLDQR
jgi:CRP-like cAMP-binding protein